MGCIRRHLRQGVWLTLVALALQFALSFGHIHAEDVAGTQPGTTIQTAASSPEGDDTHDDVAHKACAVCLLAAMAAFMPPTPAAAPLAMAQAERLAPPDGAVMRAPSGRAHFQPRAPPSA